MKGDRTAVNGKTRDLGKFTIPLLAFVVLLFSYPCQTTGEKKTTSQEAVAADRLTQADREVIREWDKGPVRYILTFDDVHTYKELKTDAERLRFINRFWFKRDPTPFTLRNEFRLQFRERVRTANELFTLSTEPGWKTDRGKIYIMLGPPNQVETLSDLQAPSVGEKGDDFGHRGAERWFYMPRKELNIYQEIVIVFSKDSSGEYRTSYNPGLYRNTLGLVMNPGKSPLEGSAAQIEEEISTMIVQNYLNDIKADLGEAIDTAQYDERHWKALVQTSEYYKAIDKTPEVLYFPSESEVGTAVIMAAFKLSEFYRGEIPETVSVPVALYGRVSSLNGDGAEYSFSSDRYAPNHVVREGEKATVMASLQLPPGRYAVSGVIHDLYGGTMRNFQREINVPDLNSCTLGINACVFARSIDEKKAEVYPVPFGMNVIPKVDNEFHKAENFGIYYQVCGLGSNAETGKKDYDVAYQFFRKEKNKQIRIGHSLIFSGRTEAEQGWSFPLAKWPSGDYVLEIEIHDKVKDQKALSSIDFKVLE